MYFTGSYRLSQLVPVCAPPSLLILKDEKRNNNLMSNERIIFKNFPRIFNSLTPPQSLRSALLLGGGEIGEQPH